MARVKQQNSGKQNASGGQTRGAQISKQRNKHKVVLERNGQNDGKSKQVVRGCTGNVSKRAHTLVKLSFRVEPPPGYTFIPLGNTQLTAALKDFARRGGHTIMPVTVRAFRLIHV